VGGAQRDDYNATGKATRTAEEDFMDAFAGGAPRSAHLALLSHTLYSPLPQVPAAPPQGPGRLQCTAGLVSLS
jgi:hypothetical protein